MKDKQMGGFPCIPAMPQPRRIRTAFRAWQMLTQIENGVFTPDGSNILEARPLTSIETGLKNACLETMRNFVNGEIDITDEPSISVFIPTEQVEEALVNLYNKGAVATGEQPTPQNIAETFKKLKESLDGPPV